MPTGDGIGAWALQAAWEGLGGIRKQTAVKGYDHGYDAGVFYFGLALDTKVC
jgi:hypothetical protein